MECTLIKFVCSWRKLVTKTGEREILRAYSIEEGV